MSTNADGNQSHSPGLPRGSEGTEQAPLPPSAPPFGTRGIQKGTPVDILAVHACVIFRAGLGPHDRRASGDRQIDSFSSSAGMRQRHLQVFRCFDRVIVADSKTESEQSTYNSDGEHNGKEKPLMLFNCRRYVTATTSVYHGT